MVDVELQSRDSIVLFFLCAVLVYPRDILCRSGQYRRVLGVPTHAKKVGYAPYTQQKGRDSLLRFVSFSFRFV